MNYETQEFVGVKDYIEMIRLKTAVLIAAALKIGAIVAAADTKDTQKIYDFGINIGLAFQLRDDLLDAFGEQEVFGKPIGNDIVTNKKTFLYIVAYDKADSSQTNRLNRAFKLQNNKEKISSVLEIYNELNIKKETEKMIETYFEKSIQHLDNITLAKEQKAELYSFAKGLMSREV